MVIPQVGVFAVHNAALGKELLEAAKVYVAANKLGVFRPEALHQMSVPFMTLVAELLMFGGDVWPDDVEPAFEKRLVA